MAVKQNLRKVLALALSCMLALSMTPVGVSLTGAALASSWADRVMAELAARKIMDAMPKKPDEAITREGFTVILAKAALYRSGASLPEAKPGGLSIFEDADMVQSKNYPYILYLYENKLLYGSSDNGKRYIRPDWFITKQDAATFIGLWLGLDPNKDINPATLFTDDNSISEYAKSIVYQLANLNIITGNPDKSYSPRKSISYAETASMIYKTLEGKLLRTYFGDGDKGNANGSAFETRFAEPSGVCLDNNGNLIVFDTYNASIKRIKNGKSETFLGFSAVTDDYGYILPQYLDGARTTALFGRPVGGVYAPNGDLFIVDSANHAIRLLRDNVVYTYAGGTSGFANGKKDAAKFNSPSAIAIDKDGSLYIADTMNHCIRKIVPDGTVTSIAGSAGKSGYADGKGSVALFCEPSGIAVDDKGVLYVADTGNHLIRKIENGAVTTITGTAAAIPAGEDYRPGGYKDSTAKTAMFNFPRGLCFADGVLIIADTGNHAVRVLTKENNVITVAGSGEPGDLDGPFELAMMNKPSSVAYGGGALYIADTYNNKVRIVWFDLKSLR